MDSGPYPTTYDSTKPVKSAWKNHGQGMIGVHAPSGTEIPSTRISPERYERLHAAHARLNPASEFL